MGFLTALVRELEALEHIDPARVYVAGMSNGGFMSERLACEASSTFAAVGVVAATLSERLAATCKPQRAVPMVYFNGTEDPLVPYDGGDVGGGRGRALGAEASADRWRQWNGCTGPAVTRALPETAHDATAVRERSWTACRDGSAVVTYRIDGGGHTWPGGFQYMSQHLIGRTTHNLDANQALWAFFSAHPKQPDPAPQVVRARALNARDGLANARHIRLPYVRQQPADHRVPGRHRIPPPEEPR